MAAADGVLGGGIPDPSGPMWKAEQLAQSTIQDVATAFACTTFSPEILRISFSSSSTRERTFLLEQREGKESKARRQKTGLDVTKNTKSRYKDNGRTKIEEAGTPRGKKKQRKRKTCAPSF